MTAELEPGEEVDGFTYLGTIASVKEEQAALHRRLGVRRGKPETIEEEVSRLMEETAPGGKRHNQELEAVIAEVEANLSIDEAEHIPAEYANAVIGVDTAEAGADETVYSFNGRIIGEDELYIYQCNGCAELFTYHVSDSPPVCIVCSARAVFGRGIPLVADTTELGRLVRKVWVNFVKETVESPKPAHIAPWEECPEYVQQADARIGYTLLMVFHSALEQYGASKLLQTAILLNLLNKQHDESEEESDEEEILSGMVTDSYLGLTAAISSLQINEDALPDVPEFLQEFLDSESESSNG